MKIRTIVTLALSVGLAATAQAQSTPIEQWQIIEGQGVTDNYVYIGMSRKEARTRTANGNCNGPVTQCSFRAQDRSEAPVITLFFDGKGKVASIQIINAEIAWPTTRGATDAMTAQQVQALYPKSTLTMPSFNVETVTTRTQHYSFNQQTTCAEEFCSVLSWHTVRKAVR